jgi:hypothetical protein
MALLSIKDSQTDQIKTVQVKSDIVKTFVINIYLSFDSSGQEK